MGNQWCILGYISFHMFSINGGSANNGNCLVNHSEMMIFREIFMGI